MIVTLIFTDGERLTFGGTVSLATFGTLEPGIAGYIINPHNFNSSEPDQAVLGEPEREE